MTASDSSCRLLACWRSCAAWAPDTLLDRSGRWAKAAIVAALLEGAVSIVVMMPVPLSYFSPLVGGLPGATALGMEPTYYWDALSPEARGWLTEHTEPGETILFATNPHSWLYLRQIGALPQRLVPIRSRPTEMVRAPKPARCLFADRPIARRRGPAGLFRDQARHPSDLDLSLQRVRATEHADSPLRRGTFRSGAMSNPARPTGLLRKWTTSMITHE